MEKYYYLLRSSDIGTETSSSGLSETLSPVFSTRSNTSVEVPPSSPSSQEIFFRTIAGGMYLVVVFGCQQYSACSGDVDEACATNASSVFCILRKKIQP